MNKKSFVDEMTKQIKQRDAELEILQAKKEQVKAEIKEEYYKQLQDLREKRKSAKEKLEEVKKSSEEAWEKLKSGTEEAFNVMTNTFSSAMSKFK